jgi:hypothetical protein
MLIRAERVTSVVPEVLEFQEAHGHLDWAEWLRAELKLGPEGFPIGNHAMLRRLALDILRADPERIPLSNKQGA